MNEVLQQLTQRKSCRVFTDRAITPEERQQILEAAVQAPTAGNQQLYTILDITDPQLKEALVHSCDEQPFIAQGKLVLIFCADCLKWYEAFRVEGCEPRKPGVGDFLLAVSDALIAAQNAVVAAQSLGIGSCYIGDIMENCETQRKLLNLPEYVFPAAMLVFGYPTQQQLDREKPVRSPMDTIVQENGYQPHTPQQLQRMLQCKTTQPDYRQWLNAFCKRKYNSDFSREMTRSVSEYLRQFER